MTGLCGCGCGLPAPLAEDSVASRGYVRGMPMKFIRGHATRKPSGRMYLKRAIPGTRRVKSAHRAICEGVLGRLLAERNQVHHVDGDKTNNSHANLVICEDGAYHKLLHYRALVKSGGGNPNTDGFCGKCQKVKAASEFGRSSCAASCRGGLSERCAECKRAKNRLDKIARRSLDKDGVNAYQREYRAKRNESGNPISKAGGRFSGCTTSWGMQ